MDTQKQSVVERLQKANNVLVTVSNNPSVDQLSACIGLALALNKLDKHATAVYSGKTPSTIEFLKPEETLEKTTDSLRDFIISLDKSKADKLRYKVEDAVVRIFITPYRTSISDKDLEFSQGDFNVDVVLALGVHEQQDLDQAITAHGRILHDATVVTVNNADDGKMGGINWVVKNTSSLSEIATDLVGALGKDLLDEQIATALLTGIVAETDRFSNEKTSADTMKASAALMAAGANQQLVATKLQEPEPEPAQIPEEKPAEVSAEQPAEEPHSDDGTLEIDHAAITHDFNPSEDLNQEAKIESSPNLEAELEGLDLPLPPLTPTEPPQIHGIKGAPLQEPAHEEEKPAEHTEDVPSGGEPPKPSIEPPAEKEHYDNPRTTASQPEIERPPFTGTSEKQDESNPTFTNPLSLPPVDAITTPPPVLDHPHETLQDIEKQVNSPHLAAIQDEKPADEPSGTDGSEELDLSKLQRPEGIDTDEPSVEKKEDVVEAARDAVAQAMAQDTSRPPGPIEALNAQPLGDSLHQEVPTTQPTPELPLQPSTPPPVMPPSPPLPPITPQYENAPPVEQPMTMPLPGVPPTQPTQPAQKTDSGNSAPPVPPPIMPPFQQ